MSIELVLLSNHLILCNSLLLPSMFSSIRIFSSQSALPIWWPKYSSFSFSISPPTDYSGLISFKIDWFDLLAVQGTIERLLQAHSLKASILQHSAFLMVHFSVLYIWLLENPQLWLYGPLSAKWDPCFLISRFIKTFLPRSKSLLISWLESPSTVILQPKKIKSIPVSTYPWRGTLRPWHSSGYDPPLLSVLTGQAWEQPANQNLKGLFHRQTVYIFREAIHLYYLRKQSSITWEAWSSLEPHTHLWQMIEVS